MSSEKPRYIPVDELLPYVSLEQAAAFYGVPLPELNRVGDEIRTRCFLNCGRAGEAPSSLAILRSSVATTTAARAGATWCRCAT